MKIIYLFFFFLITGISSAQQIVSGKVIDTKGVAIAGANIFIQGTYDGETSAEDGSFSFKTSAEGEQVLVVSFLSFQTQQISLLVSKMKNLQIVLKEDLNSLDAVIINAGTFEAGDKSRVSVLKPLDIVTTAGSAGNIIAALQTLPGTQTVGESGRLFVRGGEAGETQTFVDGLRVSQPYNASVQNIPSRGRFSPFLFSGISFSTGGYSAEYGNALSGILLLNTENEVSQEKTEISLMTVGAGIGNTQKWEHESLSVNGSYINLAPYMALAPQNINWNHPYQSLSGEAVYRNSLKKGIWKVYAAFDASTFDFNREASDFTSTERIELKNNNFYFNTSYNGNFGDKWQIISGLSYGYNLDNVHFNEDKISDQEQAVHLKNKLSKRISESVKLSFGADFFSTDFQENYDASEMPAVKNNFQEILFALYSEADIRFSKNFALKAGMRGTYNALFKESYLSPRLSLAYKTSKSAQFSIAYGNFVQTPGQEYLKYTQNLTSEKATHYIVNYQFQKENTLLRLEAYYKRYNNLITYSGTGNRFLNLQNTGKGYAKGLDLFWRDGSSFKNLEYWFSYSYINSQRKYKNFPVEATPGFIANHTASLVTKYWISNWRSQLGFSDTFTSGRPYNDPNSVQFMAEKTKCYNNLSFNWAYLLSDQKILYFSVSNVLGTKNVYNYEYSSVADANGNYNRRAVTPTADRFFFVGFFWTISDDKKSNQLKNL